MFSQLLEQAWARKKDSDAFSGFKRKPLDTNKYPQLKNDADYHKWNLDFKRQATTDGIDRILDAKFDLITSTRAGDDRDLGVLQDDFLAQVLSYTLLTTKGKGLCGKYETKPLMIWKEYLEHHTSSDAAATQAAKLMVSLTTMKVSDHPSREDFFTAYEDIAKRHISTFPIGDATKLTYLRNAIRTDDKLVNTWLSVVEARRLSKTVGPHQPMSSSSSALANRLNC